MRVVGHKLSSCIGTTFAQLSRMGEGVMKRLRIVELNRFAVASL